MGHKSKNPGQLYLESIRARFHAMKRLGQGALDQLNDADLNWQANEECNSIAIIVKHLRGNMLSRWTDALTTDGEKPDRKRDTEFITDDRGVDRETLMGWWEEGWQCLLAAMDSFEPEDLPKTITIRSEPHSLLDAINRQFFHVSYHVGQIVQIAKERKGTDWKTLSLPRGQSEAYIAEMRGRFGSTGKS